MVFMGVLWYAVRYWVVLAPQVHRVWEYDRLLSQLILFTPDSHPDYPDLHSTVEKVHLVCMMCVCVCTVCMVYT